MPDFKEVFTAEKAKNAFVDQAKVAENQIKGAASGFVGTILDTSMQLGSNVLNLTAYLSTLASKVVSRPLESVTGAVEGANTWINSSINELVTGIPTSPMWYLKQGVSMLDPMKDSMGRMKPYPNTVIQPYKEKQDSYNPFTGELKKPLDQIIQKGQDLVRQYDFTGMAFSDYGTVDQKNKYKSISYIIKPYSYTETERLAKPNITSKGKPFLFKTGNVTLFDVMNFRPYAGIDYSCTLAPKGLAPALKHSKSYTWLPLSEPPSIRMCDVMEGDSLQASTNALWYSAKLRAIEQIDITLAETRDLDITGWLKLYKDAIFPTNSTYVARPIKEVYSVFTYFVYDGGDANTKNIVRMFEFYVIPLFSLEYGVKEHKITFKVIGESNVSAN